MVILVTVGIFFQIDQTEEILSVRAEQTNDLERLRLVAQRATSNLVMSNEALPPKEIAEDGEGASRVGRARNSRDPSLPIPAPRFILERDPRAQGALLTGTGGGEWRADATPVQRMEFVVADPPVPQDGADLFLRAGLRPGERVNRAAAAGILRGNVSGQRASALQGGEGAEAAGGSKGLGGDGRGKSAGRNAKSEATGAGTGVESGKQPTTTTTSGAGAAGRSFDPNRDDPQANAAPPDADQAPVRAARGAFELRPQPLTGKRLRKAQASGIAPVQAWEMWWVPLPPRHPGSEAPSDEEMAFAGPPYRIASNIRYAKWTVFDDREKKYELKATWEQQLPAHIELAVETTGGLTANWMFEVDWGRGPEVPPAPVLSLIHI